MARLVNWQSCHSAATARNPPLLPLTKRIKTYAEQFEQGDDLERIHREIHNAACVVFLGFAYHEANMALLKPKNSLDQKTVLGTAYKMSTNDRDVVAGDILSMFAEPQKTNMRTGRRIMIDPDVTCSQLFDSWHAR